MCLDFILFYCIFCRVESSIVLGVCLSCEIVGEGFGGICVLRFFPLPNATPPVEW